MYILTFPFKSIKYNQSCFATPKILTELHPSNAFFVFFKQEPEKKAGSEELDLFADSDEEAPVKPAKPAKKKAPKQDQVCFYSLSSNYLVKFFSSAFLFDFFVLFLLSCTCFFIFY